MLHNKLMIKLNNILNMYKVKRCLLSRERVHIPTGEVRKIFGRGYVGGASLRPVGATTNKMVKPKVLFDPPFIAPSHCQTSPPSLDLRG